jgi:hypothetical protein
MSRASKAPIARTMVSMWEVGCVIALSPEPTPTPSSAASATMKPQRHGCDGRTGMVDGRLRFDSQVFRHYFAAMPSRLRTSKKDSPASLAKRMSRRWRVVLLRAKGEILGTVEAPDAQAAKAAAAVQFELDEIQRNRIMVAGVGVSRGLSAALPGKKCLLGRRQF